jgi:hypothetical protein
MLAFLHNSSTFFAASFLVFQLLSLNIAINLALMAFEISSLGRASSSRAPTPPLPAGAASAAASPLRPLLL